MLSIEVVNCPTLIDAYAIVISCQGLRFGSEKEDICANRFEENAVVNRRRTGRLASVGKILMGALCSASMKVVLSRRGAGRCSKVFDHTLPSKLFSATPRHFRS